MTGREHVGGNQGGDWRNGDEGSDRGSAGRSRQDQVGIRGGLAGQGAQEGTGIARCMVVMMAGFGCVTHQAAGGDQRQREVDSRDEDRKKDRPAFGAPRLHRHGFPVCGILYPYPETLSTDACSPLLQKLAGPALCVYRFPDSTQRRPEAYLPLRIYTPRPQTR